MIDSDELDETEAAFADAIALVGEARVECPHVNASFAKVVEGVDGTQMTHCPDCGKTVVLTMGATAAAEVKEPTVFELANAHCVYCQNAMTRGGPVELIDEMRARAKDRTPATRLAYMHASRSEKGRPVACTAERYWQEIEWTCRCSGGRKRNPAWRVECDQCGADGPRPNPLTEWP